MGWAAAIIVIVLLFIFPRQMGVLFLILIAVIGFFMLKEYKDSNDRKRDRESVSIVVSYTPDTCSEDYPLKFKITNGSKKIVNKVEWNITATREGYSNNVVNYNYSGYGEYDTPFSSDKILKSGEWFSACYKAPFTKGKVPPQNLIWKVSKKYIVFQ